MKKRSFHVACAFVALAAFGAIGVKAQDHPARPTYKPNGTVIVPSFELPPSVFQSKESIEILKMRSMMGGAEGGAQVDIATARAGVERQLAPFLRMMRERYPTNVVEQTIGGVPTRIITPRDKPVVRKRVLMNLHGGAFSICADACALLESMPIAALGGYRVVTVNYRMAPEAKHPAGLEDAVSVYRELLKQYKPSQIGVYGCSAGGALTSQMAAWLPANKMPQPGAIGIFGAGAVRFAYGDSAHLAAYIDGGFAPPPRPGDAPRPAMDRGYFANADQNDPLLSPAQHPAIIAKFPPTMLITGTRAFDLSPAVYTNSMLLKAGVRSTLIVGEGMGHCYIYLPQFPESQDAYQATVNFFRENLK